jgi:hypothetical protein
MFPAKNRGEPSAVTPPRAAHPTSPANSGAVMEAASIVPPPRRRASPTGKTKRRGLLSSLHCVTLRSQTRPSTAQRGRNSPRPVAGGRAEEKKQTSLFAFFARAGGVRPPPPPRRRSGACFARPDFRLTSRTARISPRLTQAKPPPRKIGCALHFPVTA